MWDAADTPPVWWPIGLFMRQCARRFRSFPRSCCSWYCPAVDIRAACRASLLHLAHSLPCVLAAAAAVLFHCHRYLLSLSAVLSRGTRFSFGCCPHMGPSRRFLHRHDPRARRRCWCAPSRTPMFRSAALLSHGRVVAWVVAWLATGVGWQELVFVACLVSDGSATHG